MQRPTTGRCIHRCHRFPAHVWPQRALARDVLYLPDAGVAWRHAVVRRAGDGFELALLPDSDATARVGEQSVAPGSAHPLRSGDRIRLGNAELEFVGR